MARLGYVTLGTNDLERAAAFHDELLGSIGHERIFQDENGFIAWGTSLEEPALAIAPPFDGRPATVGNGIMAAIDMDSREQVDALYARAIELGGTDEGPPGQRVEGFYAGYFRDLDGNKLNAFVFG